MDAKITAKLIAHSINPEGKELLSIEAVSPYFLDAEIEKHGQLCSNSSSNRAIPFHKMAEAPYYTPRDIRKNTSGMQGFDTLGKEELAKWEHAVYSLRDLSVHTLIELESEFNIHKQHLNRYLAPWSMQKKILTGSREAWNHVMGLRNHKDADPSIQVWAKEIQKILDTSKPVLLEYGDWHLPYITKEERYNDKYRYEELLIISTARCARTSYRLHDGSDTTFKDDKKLYDFLVNSKPSHATPLTHQGLCFNPKGTSLKTRGITHMMKDGTLSSGELTGWIQFRHWCN